MAKLALLVAMSAVAIVILKERYAVLSMAPPSTSSDMCTMREVVKPLDCETFVTQFMGREPLIIRKQALPHILWNEEFREDSSNEVIAERHGHLPVKLSTANAFTGHVWTETTLKDYMNKMLKPQEVDKKGNQTFYLFGSQYGPEWEAYLSKYVSPASIYPSETLARRLGALRVCDSENLARLQNDEVSLSFGVAGRDTGVPFHFHGPGFLQQLHGRKRWFLYPPHSKPDYHPNETTYHWVQHTLPRLVDEGKAPTHDCVLEAGDVIYFPNEWMHATLNMDNYTCFMASFA